MWKHKYPAGWDSMKATSTLWRADSQPSSSRRSTLRWPRRSKRRSTRGQRACQLSTSSTRGVGVALRGSLVVFIKIRLTFETFTSRKKTTRSEIGPRGGFTDWERLDQARFASRPRGRWPTMRLHVTVRDIAQPRWRKLYFVGRCIARIRCREGRDLSRRQEWR